MTIEVEWPFVGRLEESAFLAHALERSGVVIAGAAGVGKSRLASALLEHAQQHGAVIRSVVATRAARSIPFGALAGFLPAADRPLSDSPVGLMRELAGALVALGGDGGLVLGVDDAHLLDDGSAALVAQLGAGGQCRLVLTVRSGEPVPDAVASLWKDRHAGYLELQPLSADETGELLRSALGGEVDGGTASRIFGLTLGNPLFVRELVAAGLESDRLVDQGGVWRWGGGLVAGRRLSEVVASRLERLSATERELLELIAVSEPLELGLLERLSAIGPLVALERAGLIEVVQDRRRSHLRFAHPLYGEVLRAEAPALGAKAKYGALAGALAAVGARRREDGLRAATWALEAGLASSPDLLVGGARQALLRFDAGVAERLARAALDAGGGAAAAEALGRALAGGGQFAEAEAVLASASADALTDEERLAVGHARTLNLIYGLGRAEDAFRVALDTEAQIMRADLRSELTALRGYALSVSGLPREALRVLSEIPAGVGTRAGVQAAITEIGALGSTGRCEAAKATAGQWYEAALGLDPELPFASTYIQTARSFALWQAGWWDEAQAIAETEYQRALDRRSHEYTSLWSLILGTVWLMRGRPRTALRWLRESAALFREFDAIGHFPWCLAYQAQALTMLGDAPGAQAAIDEADARRHPAIHIYDPDLDRGHAWAAAAGGEREAACAWARRLADDAEHSGRLPYAVRALGDLVLFGEIDGTADRLEALLPAVDGPLAPAIARWARAVADGNGEGLDGAASELSAAGVDYPAAHAAHAAAAAHRVAARAASARASAARARTLLDGCEGARLLFAADAGGDVSGLTDREREIATLAARGLSNEAIAAQLVLSVRTVENHLQRAYMKLGVAGRRELGVLLGIE